MHNARCLTHYQQVPNPNACDIDIRNGAAAAMCMMAERQHTNQPRFAERMSIRCCTKVVVRKRTSKPNNYLPLDPVAACILSRRHGNPKSASTAALRFVQARVHGCDGLLE